MAVSKGTCSCVGRGAHSSIASCSDRSFLNDKLGGKAARRSMQEAAVRIAAIVTEACEGSVNNNQGGTITASCGRPGLAPEAVCDGSRLHRCESLRITDGLLIGLVWCNGGHLQ